MANALSRYSRYCLAIRGDKSPHPFPFARSKSGLHPRGSFRLLLSVCPNTQIDSEIFGLDFLRFDEKIFIADPV